ncbi:DEAD/DEAH box helicase domain-containing protein [Ditylenchus destructor]|uniref:RNA helicase n=1 Tax=Ditylenchus destructor TaxID=166010 RepID=A0AAD4QW50_9BILA|nr:DEAD/DEAH box helicase domain-containing protein [Ditylenchus destructor]
MEPQANYFQSDETGPDKADISYLNKILNQKLNLLNDGVVEVRKQQSDPNSPLYSVQTFEGLRLKPELLKSLKLMGFYQPSKIQEVALPQLLVEPPQDMIAQSQSGTGKTATFLLVMLNRVDPTKKCPQCICLAPTLELAKQIGDVATKMAQLMPDVKVRYAVKGERANPNTPFTEQIVIGTPGKMLDWIQKYRLIDAQNIICFVLDEADIMISQEGHQEASIKIHNEIISANQNCQCMLFSATYSDRVFEFAEQLIADPVIITIRRQDQSLPYIRQYYIRCEGRDKKYQAIVALYQSLTVASSIIFCYTRSSAVWLAEKLRQSGRDCALLHGELSVPERAQVAEDFREGRHNVLITTNVSARGLDMPQVSLVVNYDPPVTYEEYPKADFDTYLHRIGRTGRFGKPGIAINLVDGEAAMEYVNAFREHFGRSIDLLDAEDYDQLESIEKETHDRL